MSEMIERLTKVIELGIADLDLRVAGPLNYSPIARAVLAGMRELPEEPGPRYTAGEYSRNTQAAMVDDALNA